MYEKYLKRPLDFIMSLIALVILAPLFFVLMLVIKLKLGSPVIFKQKRIGYKNQEFTMYKFKSMLDKKEEAGMLIPDKFRLTPFGKKLRASSLDELPELINILKGEMSFIGPRPLHIRYLKLYNEYQIKRHNVRPGLTGLAQVKGRNSLDWEDRFNLDVDYTQNITFWGDLKILYLTVITVFKADNVDSNQGGIMPAFTGNKRDNKENAIDKVEECENL